MPELNPAQKKLLKKALNLLEEDTKTQLKLSFHKDVTEFYTKQLDDLLELKKLLD